MWRPEENLEWKSPGIVHFIRPSSETGPLSGLTKWVMPASVRDLGPLTPHGWDLQGCDVTTGLFHTGSGEGTQIPVLGRQGRH